MASADVDLTEKIRMLNMNLKKEQEQAVKELQNGNDVLAVLPTGFGKSRIFKAFERLKDNETNGRATILVIAPLASIIKDQLNELRSQGYLAADLSSFGPDELKACDFKIILSSAEEVMKAEFQDELKNRESELHRRLCCIVVDESHTVETWTGKRYFIHQMVFLYVQSIASFYKE